MHFDPLAIEDACLLRIEPAVDARGFFARTFCAREFAAHGLPEALVQSSLSRNSRRGTVRGLHFQWPPSREGKLVRCVRGRLFDVQLDLRPASRSYLRHVEVTLDARQCDAVFIPPGVAHGFQTLENDTDVLYQMSDFHAPELSDGLRWNDAAFGIRWPLPVTVISGRDLGYPDFDPCRFEQELARRGRTA